MTDFQKVSWLLHGKVRIETQVGLSQTFNIYMLDILVERGKEKQVKGFVSK